VTLERQKLLVVFVAIQLIIFEPTHALLNRNSLLRTA